MNSGLSIYTLFVTACRVLVAICLCGEWLGGEVGSPNEKWKAAKTAEEMQPPDGLNSKSVTRAIYTKVQIDGNYGKPKVNRVTIDMDPSI